MHLLYSDTTCTLVYLNVEQYTSFNWMIRLLLSILCWHKSHPINQCELYFMRASLVTYIIAILIFQFKRYRCYKLQKFWSSLLARRFVKLSKHNVSVSMLKTIFVSPGVNFTGILWTFLRLIKTAFFTSRLMPIFLLCIADVLNSNCLGGWDLQQFI